VIAQPRRRNAGTCHHLQRSLDTQRGSRKVLIEGFVRLSEMEDLYTDARMKATCAYSDAKPLHTAKHS